MLGWPKFGPDAVPRIGRAALRLLIAAAIAYAIVLLGMFVAQRSLLYPAPDRFPDVPAGFAKVSLRTADGLTLSAAYRPARPGLPTLVFFHGNGDSWAGGAAATAKLASAGMGVLLSEYRGYGDNPGKPSEAGLFADGRAALAWLKARGIGSEQLAIAGNSLGSGVAVQMALETRPAALILISPFSSMSDLVAERFSWLPGRLLLLDQFENGQKLDRIRSPLLILHGKADAVIPYAHARRLAVKSTRAKLVLFERAGHELAYMETAQDTELGWLRKLWPNIAAGN